MTISTLWPACILLSFSVMGQNTSMKYNDVQTWPEIAARDISNDGKYAWYVVDDPKTEKRLVVQNIDKATKSEFFGLANWYSATFSEDSRYIMFQLPGDTLKIIQLDGLDDFNIVDCSAFETILFDHGTRIAYYSMKNKRLTLIDLSTRAKEIYTNIIGYTFSADSRILIVKKEVFLNNSISSCWLEWIEIENGGRLSFWKGSTAERITFNETGDAIVFSCGDVLWYFQKNMQKARLLADNKKSKLSFPYKLSNAAPQFGSKSDKVFFRIIKEDTPVNKLPYSSSVDIWNYKDEYLQPEQLRYLNRPTDYLCVYNLRTNAFRCLESDSNRNESLNLAGVSDYILNITSFNSWEASRIQSDKVIRYLVDTDSGEGAPITKGFSGMMFNFSPRGKYVIWYSVKDRAYFVYCVATKDIRNISNNISVKLYNELTEYGRPPISNYGIGFWSENDEFVYVYDRYDIWRVDPTGRNQPLNISNGYGRRTRSILRFIETTDLKSFNGSLNPDSTVVLCAFNETTKENGFYSSKLNIASDPVMLIMSPDLYYFPGHLSFVTFPIQLQKAKYSNTYLLTRSNVNEFPNLCITKDFKTFRQITHLSPQKDYNWITSELVTWTAKNGRLSEGILYKPSDFDSAKKYPIIYLIYERWSYGLNKYLIPELNAGALNIPFYVSNGYLVVCPDIYYEMGEAGQSAFDYVISSVEAIKRLPYIDTNAIGLQGHSFGAYETNYIITKTNLFAAAASAAGNSDLVSSSNSLRMDIYDNHDDAMNAQHRMGATLWQKPEIYINNSPIFTADKVSTPLLIMHSKNDNNVFWNQSVEYFTALRYLSKQVWMLQYDNGSHTLNDPIDQRDYTKRLKQYFDHYLKRQAPPKWMTQGRPASLKQIDDRFELDTDGFCGKDCKICKEKRYDMKDR